MKAKLAYNPFTGQTATNYLNLISCKRDFQTVHSKKKVISYFKELVIYTPDKLNVTLSPCLSKRHAMRKWIIAVHFF
jgi:hypothetical protein